MSDRKGAAVRQVKEDMTSGSALAARLANDDAFADAIGDLAESDVKSPEFAKIAADPKQYFEKRKVALPPNARVMMSMFSGHVTVEICMGICITVTVSVEM